MDDIRKIIAQNLVELRKKNKLTQAELAEKLNYSDKAISKWENGNAIPEMEIMLKLASLYNVTLDYLVTPGTDKDKEQMKKQVPSSSNKLIISLLATCIVYMVATLVYVILLLSIKYNGWTFYVWGIPISSILYIVFNEIWSKKYRRLFRAFFESILVWSILACLYLQLLLAGFNLWALFIIGVPLQVAIILWFFRKRTYTLKK